jgi:hypothetical protein
VTADRRPDGLTLQRNRDLHGRSERRVSHRHLIVTSTVTLLSIAVSWLSFRSSKVRVVTEGEPIILVQDMQIIQRNLRRELSQAPDRPAGRAHVPGCQLARRMTGASWPSRASALGTRGDGKRDGLTTSHGKAIALPWE